MIKTVIFDIGNVLADFSWEPFFRSFEFSEDVYTKLVRATVKSPEWNELDRGARSTEKIIASFVENDPSIEQEIRRVFQDVNAMVTKRDCAIRWIGHLKKAGYQVLYLSNLGEITRAHCRDALSFIPYTDGGVLSYEVKAIKPEPAIYQALIDKYDLKPEECVFVDDIRENVEAAKKMGFEIVHATTHEVALKELAALGVPPYKNL